MHVLCAIGRHRPRVHVQVGPLMLYCGRCRQFNRPMRGLGLRIDDMKWR